MRRRPLLPTLEPLEDRAVPADFTVTSLADSGAGTLREAIGLAFQNEEADTIRFSVSGTISLQSSLYVLADGVTIDGAGPGNITIERAGSATGEFPLVRVDEAALTLKGLRLANGATTSAVGTVPSGVLVTDGASLTVEGSLFEDFDSYYGAVIEVDQGAATVTGSVFRGSTRGDVQQRGVIHNLGGTLTVSGSTFIDNDTGVGGAIFTEGTANERTARTFIDNVTITGTSSFTAIATLGIIGQVQVAVTHSTVVGNAGSAVSNAGGLSTVTLRGNVFADNGLSIFNSGTLITQGGNVADDAPAGLDPGTDRLNADARLGPLGDYGGPVPTFALLPGSPALDLMPPGQGLSTDARGVPRGNDAGDDAGAFEGRGYALTVVSGDSQSTTVGEDFADPLVVVVTEGGTPLPGVAVTFNVAFGDSSFPSGTSVTVVTNAQGVASAGPLTAGTAAGTTMITASAGDLSANFFLFADADEAVALRLDGYGGEMPLTDVLPGEPFTLYVSAVDRFGNRVFGSSRVVGFTSSDPAATLPAPQSVDDEINGVDGFVLATPGTRTITVTEQGAANGLSGTITLSVTGVALDAGENEFVNEADRFLRALKVEGSAGPFTVLVDYGDGTEAGQESLQTDDQGNFLLDHVYTTEGSYKVRIQVVDAEERTTESTVYVHVLLRGINTDLAVEIELGGLDDATATDSAPGITATFFRAGRPGDPSFLTIVPVPVRVADGLDGDGYTTVVINGQLTAIVRAFDVRGVNIGPDDYATVTFTYFNDDFDQPRLFYFDKQEEEDVEVDLTQPGADVDRFRRTITFTFNSDSDPTLQKLTETVFTITVPLAVPTPVTPGTGSSFFPLALLGENGSSSSSFGLGRSGGGLGGQGGAALDSAYDGPGTVGGKALASLFLTTTGLVGDVDVEEEAEVAPWFMRRARGVGALADLPPPPDEAAAMPGVTLTPAEPRALDFGPPPDDRPGPREEEESDPPWPDETKAGDAPADEVFIDRAGWPTLAGSPLLLPLAGMVDARPRRRRR